MDITFPKEGNLYDPLLRRNVHQDISFSLSTDGNNTWSRIPTSLVYCTNIDTRIDKSNQYCHVTFAWSCDTENEVLQPSAFYLDEKANKEAIWLYAELFLGTSKFVVV